MADEEWQEIGKVTDYFSKVGAVAVELTKGTLKMGDVIKIKGHTTCFEQTVTSMQLNNQPVQEGKEGDSIGIKVDERVRKHDIVYKKIQ